MKTNLPRTRSIRHLSAEEIDQLNDELHPLTCDCPVCLPEAHDAAETAHVAAEVAA